MDNWITSLFSAGVIQSSPVMLIVALIFYLYRTEKAENDRKDSEYREASRALQEYYVTELNRLHAEYAAEIARLREAQKWTPQHPRRP